MTQASPELAELVKGAATLATCVVHSLNRRDPGYQKTFLKSLDEAHAILRDDPSSGSNDLVIALLVHTRTLLTGHNIAGGPQRRFLPDWPPCTDDRYDPHRPESYFE